MLEWWRECENFLRLLYTGNITNLLETRAEATDNVSVEFQEERLRFLNKILL